MARRDLLPANPLLAKKRPLTLHRCLSDSSSTLADIHMKSSVRKQKVHSLTGRITFPLLLASFKAVKRNRGAAGIDKVSVSMFEANLEENLLALVRDLKDGSFRPMPLRRKWIPKGSGKLRPLGIPAVRAPSLWVARRLATAAPGPR